jgi:intein/homing endonuclease
MIILRINKKNFDLIASGLKKSEWRQYSKYNINLLFKDRGDGKKDGNNEIKQIKFINGYSAESPEIIKDIELIRLCKFSKDVDIPNDNFKALKDQFAIEIKFAN